MNALLPLPYTRIHIYNNVPCREAWSSGCRKGREDEQAYCTATCLVLLSSSVQSVRPKKHETNKHTRTYTAYTHTKSLHEALHRTLCTARTIKSYPSTCCCSLPPSLPSSPPLLVVLHTCHGGDGRKGQEDASTTHPVLNKRGCGGREGVRGNTQAVAKWLDITCVSLLASGSLPVVRSGEPLTRRKPCRA